jgi:hypothetical protein
MSYGFGSCLPVRRAPAYHTSCDPLWAAGLNNKEKPIRPARVAKLACSQRTRARFQDA